MGTQDGGRWVSSHLPESSDLDFLKLVIFSGFKDTQKDQSVQLPELASRVLKST